MRWLFAIDGGADNRWRQVAQSKQLLGVHGRATEQLRQSIERVVALGHCQCLGSMGVLEQDDKLWIWCWFVGRRRVPNDQLRIIAMPDALQRALKHRTIIQ